GAAHGAWSAGFLWRLPHRQPVRSRRRLQSRSRVVDDKQFAAAFPDILARRRFDAGGSLPARWRVDSVAAPADDRGVPERQRPFERDARIVSHHAGSGYLPWQWQDLRAEGGWRW